MEKRSFLFIFLLSISFFILNNYLFIYLFPPKQNIQQKSLQEEDYPSKSHSQELLSRQDHSNHTHHHSEKFYVLENKYQQVVFSTQGGAIAELNLPFLYQSTHPSIYIRRIRFDKLIQKNSPDNNFFPLQQSLFHKDGKKVPYPSKEGGYMPLLRRSLNHKEQESIFTMPTANYALNLVHKENEKMHSYTYSVTHLGENEIEFTSQNFPKHKKTFRISEKTPFVIELEIVLDAQTDIPPLFLTSGILEVELMAGHYTPTLQYYQNKQKKRHRIKNVKLPSKQDMPQIYSLIHPSWISMENGFFEFITSIESSSINALWVQSYSGEKIPTRLSTIHPQNQPYPAKKYPAYQFLLPLASNLEKQNNNIKYHIFAGPKQANVLGFVDEALHKKFPDAPPLNFSTSIKVRGIFAFFTEPFSKLLAYLMRMFYFITRSWAISIILLTFALRILLYPITSWSYKSQIKMQKISPKLKELKEKFKNQPKRLHVELAMLYKTEGINPLSYILPILIQIPFLIGMFNVLKSTFELRGAPFIPGWINDLTAPDIVFAWSSPLFFLGTSFHCLPLILGGLMYLQQKMTVMFTPKEQKIQDDSEQKQMKIMGNVMTGFFIFLFYDMPSGLNIYWIFSTLFGIIQNWLMIKKQTLLPKKSR